MIRVSEAKNENIEEISNFLLKSWEEVGQGALGWTGATEEKIKHISSKEFLSNLLDNRENRFFIAWIGDEVVGFSLNKKINHFDVELSGIIIRESETGKGIGSMLIESSIKAAKEDGYEVMIVKTEVYNQRAIGFYEKHGFILSEKGVEKVDETPIDVAILKKSLI